MVAPSQPAFIFKPSIPALGVLWGILFTGILAVVQAYWDPWSESDRIKVVLLAIPTSGAAAYLALLAYRAAAHASRSSARYGLSRVALWTIVHSTNLTSTPVICSAIGKRDGSIVLKIERGHDSGIRQGATFAVYNSAADTTLGLLEAVEVKRLHCLCIVRDRRSPAFWQKLEDRMDDDPAPPAGVTIRLYYEDIEASVNLIKQVLTTWRNTNG